jgi:hypothetical protein
MEQFQLADLQCDLEHCRSCCSGVGQGVAVTLDLQPSHGVEAAILRSSTSHVLVILRSQRRLVAGLPIPASDLTNRLLRRLSGTTLVISDPLH